MTTFKTFLQETTDTTTQLPSDLANLIQPALTTIHSDKPLIRGIKRQHLLDAEPVAIIDTGIENQDSPGVNKLIKIFKFNISTSRRPVSMSDKLSSRVDDWFESNFGRRFRAESMFCMPSTHDINTTLTFVSSYGTPCAVMPIGNFTYAWSPEYDDLYFSLVDNYEDDQSLHQDMEAGQYKFNTGINDVPEGHEIMVQAGSYLAAAVFTGNAPHTYLTAEEADKLAKVFWT